MAYTGSASDRLAAVRAAIDQIISGGAQTYSIRGRMVERARLRDLRQLETELQREANLESQGQISGVGMIIRPS